MFAVILTVLELVLVPSVKVSLAYPDAVNFFGNGVLMFE